MNLEQVYVSAVAFGAVFVMLALLAVLMSLLTKAFPGKVAVKKRSIRKATNSGIDQALIAAVTAAVSTAVPGGHLTKIEEVK